MFSGYSQKALVEVAPNGRFWCSWIGLMNGAPRPATPTGMLPQLPLCADTFGVRAWMFMA
ncbi:hypothetical protein D3C76_1838640 [compost metagenome]